MYKAISSAGHQLFPGHHPKHWIVVYFAQHISPTPLAHFWLNTGTSTWVLWMNPSTSIHRIVILSLLAPTPSIVWYFIVSSVHIRKIISWFQFGAWCDLLFGACIRSSVVFFFQRRLFLLHWTTCKSLTPSIQSG